MRHLRACASLLLIASCGSDVGAPETAYACTEPARIVVLKRDEMRSACFDDMGRPCILPGMALPKGVATALGVAVYDDDRRECDPADTSVAVDDEAFDLVYDGFDAYVTPLADVFDDPGGYEPSATLTVRHGGLVAQWRLLAMIDLAGVWEISIDGLVVGDFEASQSGRFIRWADCAPNDARPECSAGFIYYDSVQLQSPIGALKLEGAVQPGRDLIDGMWSNGTGQGAWVARRLP